MERFLVTISKGVNDLSKSYHSFTTEKEAYQFIKWISNMAPDLNIEMQSDDEKHSDISEHPTFI